MAASSASSSLLFHSSSSSHSPTKATAFVCLKQHSTSRRRPHERFLRPLRPPRRILLPKSSRIGSRVMAQATASFPGALFFDCDGVLVDTEKDGHRISFNDTFAERELGVTWGIELYGELLKIGGGKERMTAYFNKWGWPEKAPKSEGERKEFVASLHKRKTELFMALIEKRLLPLRPGVARLVDEALQKDVKVAVCSTSNEKAVSAIVSFLLGPKRADKIAIFAGDVVPRKKPDPAIYLLAASTLGVEPSRCVVVEDSAIGLAAAKAAGMKCIVTKSGLGHLMMSKVSVGSKNKNAERWLYDPERKASLHIEAIYLLAASTLGVEPSRCVVVEDSAIGLAAAKAAGMKCIVTKSGYTAEEDFLNADAIFDFIGDPPEERFDLTFCANLLERQYVS